MFFPSKQILPKTTPLISHFQTSKLDQYGWGKMTIEEEESESDEVPPYATLFENMKGIESIYVWHSLGSLRNNSPAFMMAYDTLINNPLEDIGEVISQSKAAAAKRSFEKEEDIGLPEEAGEQKLDEQVMSAASIMSGGFFSSKRKPLVIGREKGISSAKDIASGQISGGFGDL